MPIARSTWSNPLALNPAPERRQEIMDLKNVISDVKLSQFEEDLRKLINQHSLEQIGNIPDFLLASVMIASLVNVSHVTNVRDAFFGFRPFEKGDKE
jgi:hypothetical protein